MDTFCENEIKKAKMNDTHYDLPQLAIVYFNFILMKRIYFLQIIGARRSGFWQLIGRFNF